MRKKLFLSVFILSGCGSSGGGDVIDTPEALGEKLFSDTNLSLNKTQSCATCHDPQRAFTDPRLDAAAMVSAVSLGDDGISLGDRNTPTAMYAAFAPDFHYGTRQRFNKQNNNNTYTGFLGGQFLDGRATGLTQQSAGPPLNPVEMGMADKASVVARLQEDEDYVAGFKRVYGDDIFNDVDAAYNAMTESIAAFERTEQFAPFDSKYDRYLRGEYALSLKESTGKALFFSQFANCGICHQLFDNGDPVNKFRETFSGYEYHNIGVPENTAVRALNGVMGPDRGLLNNDAVSDTQEEGKYKVPTLRNVAVTAPYMHNGVFRSLRTVIEFYDHFVNPAVRVNNPETGAPWAAPEVSANMATTELAVGDEMTDFQVESMVCFLRLLTDQRYENLIEDDGIECADP